MNAYTEILIQNTERIVAIDLQERIVEIKNGQIREIREIAERTEVLAGSDWEFMADLIF